MMLPSPSGHAFLSSLACLRPAVLSMLQLHQKFCLPAPAAANLKQQHLTFAEFGETSSTTVVFYMHGWPGSRIGGSMLHTAAHACNVRVLAVDRPGFGGSPFTKRHSMGSWAGMVQLLADHLQIREFGVLGASGGAPFAAACGHFIPRDRVTALGLLCPVGPVAISQGMAPSTSVMMAAAKHCPWVARAVGRISRLLLLWDEQCMSRFALNQQDLLAMKAAPHAAQAIRAAVLEGLRAGARGMVHEMQLVQRCWGFSLTDIPVQHTFMWHGLVDPVVPLRMAQAYEGIPSMQATYFGQETHTTLVINRLAAALEELAALQTSSSDPLTTPAAAALVKGPATACNML